MAGYVDENLKQNFACDALWEDRILKAWELQEDIIKMELRGTG